MNAIRMNLAVIPLLACGCSDVPAPLPPAPVADALFPEAKLALDEIPFAQGPVALKRGQTVHVEGTFEVSPELNPKMVADAWMTLGRESDGGEVEVLRESLDIHNQDGAVLVSYSGPFLCDVPAGEYTLTVGVQHIDPKNMASDMLQKPILRTSLTVVE